MHARLRIEGPRVDDDFIERESARQCVKFLRVDYDGLVERVPQVLVNVPIPQPGRLADCTEVWEAVVKAEAELGHDGRVLLRSSGTEPVVRVMVEARVEAQADAIVAQLAGVVEAVLGQLEPQAPR